MVILHAPALAQEHAGEASHGARPSTLATRRAHRLPLCHADLLQKPRRFRGETCHLNRLPALPAMRPLGDQSNMVDTGTPRGSGFTIVGWSRSARRLRRAAA